MVKIETRIRGAGLRVVRLRRLAPALSPINSRKLVGETHAPFRHKIEDDFCPSVRGVFAVCPGETNALETEFSRQRASSRSRGGEVACYMDIWGGAECNRESSVASALWPNILEASKVTRLPLRPGPTLNQLKALGISSGGQAGRFEKGSGVSL
jgi:hypothetical protein